MSSSHTTFSPIVERRFFVVDEPNRIVVLTIGQPYLDTDDGVWTCPFDIQGIDSRYFTDYSKAGYGNDGLNALLYAIECVRRILTDSGLPLMALYDRYDDETFVRDDPDFLKDPNLDIPIIYSSQYGKVFEQEIRDYIELRFCTISDAVLIIKNKKIPEDKNPRKTLLDIIDQRNLELSEENKEAINACEDIDSLREWLKRSITVSSVEEIFL
jgi:hypothetical protein